MRRLIVLAALALALLAIAGPAGAAVSQGGPWAPDIRAIATTDDTTWFAATDRGLFRTADAGQTWRAVTAFPAAEGSAPAPAGFLPQAVTAYGSAVVAISADRTVAESTDFGATWTFHEHDGYWGIISLESDITGRLILTTNDNGMQVSDDGGVTWQRATVTAAGGRTLDSVQLISGGKAIGLDPNRHDNAYIVSADGGATWPTVATVDGIDSLVSIVETEPDTLIAIGTASGLAPCAPWEAPLSEALTWQQSKMLARISVDGGDNWSDGGATCTRGTMFGGGQLRGLAGIGDRVAFITGQATAAVSDDGGRTFVDVDKPPFVQSLSGFAGAGGDLVLASNAGVMLVGADTVASRSAGIQSYSGVSGMAIAPGGTQTVLVSLGDRGLFRSADGGATWAASATQVFGQAHLSSTIQPPSFSDATHAAFAVDAPGSDADHDGMRIFTTDDAGATWTLAAHPDGHEPGGPIAYGGGGTAYLPANLPYAGDLSDTSRCSVIESDTTFATLTDHPIRVGGVDANCTKLTAVAVDPADASRLLAIGQYIDGSTGELLAWRYYRSTDGGATWSVPSGLGGAFSTRDWAPQMHVSFAGSRVFIWQARSSKLCTSTDAGVSFDCAKGAFATTPGGPGWFADGYLSSFEPQADGSIIASVVDPADWTSRNDALPDAGVATFLARSVDGGVTWAIADPAESAAITDVIDVTTASARAFTTRLKAVGSRRLVVGASGVFRRRVAFKRAARGRPTARLSGIVVRKAGWAIVTITCPRGKRCTGYLRLRSSSPRLATVRTAFDVTRPTTRIALRIPKAQRARLSPGTTISVRVTIDPTVGTGGTFQTTAAVRR